MSGGGVTASGRGPGQGTAGEGAAPGLPAGSEVVVGADGLARTPWGDSSDLMRHYYDTEWGMPVRDERGLFERLSLEAFQSGLSWLTILRKREAFRAGFAGFEPAGREAEVAGAVGDHRRGDVRAGLFGADQDAFHRALVVGRDGAGKRRVLRRCGGRKQ